MIPIQNSNILLYNQKGKTLMSWGKDRTGKIVYKINNQGFRGEHDFDYKPNYAFFGTSTLFGIGVKAEDILISYFPNAHNYGLAGLYLNRESIENLKKFINSGLYDETVKIIFFWIDRPGKEDLNKLLQEVKSIKNNILHISQGIKYNGMINLMPHIDLDVSETQPGPKTHKIWAKTIKQLLNNA